MKLHIGCALAGFITMRKGANFIAKQYTIFRPTTWSLIGIYAGLFDEFYLCKPVTSRPYNSEIYLIGKGFRGLDAETRTLLECLLTADTMQLNNQPLPTVLAFANNVFNQQIVHLQENVALFEKYKSKLAVLRSLFAAERHQRVERWLKAYPAVEIPADKMI